MTDHSSPTDKAFRALPADIQAIALSRVGKPARPMSHMEIMLAIGEEVLRERKKAELLNRLGELAEKNNAAYEKAMAEFRRNYTLQGRKGAIPNE